MKNTIYTFLLGITVCVVVFVLVSFKNGDKTLEKEKMIIRVKCGSRDYELFVSTVDKYEVKKFDNTELFEYKGLLGKIQEYEKEGWVIISNNSAIDGGTTAYLFFLLEREKK